MENQYNYYTSDQNMNTENYSTGGNQDQGPKKTRKGRLKMGKSGMYRTGFRSGCKCGISDK